MDDDDFLLYGEALSPKAFSPVDKASPDEEKPNPEAVVSKESSMPSFQDFPAQEETLAADAFEVASENPEESVKSDAFLQPNASEETKEALPEIASLTSNLPEEYSTTDVPIESGLKSEDKDSFNPIEAKNDNPQTEPVSIMKLSPELPDSELTKSKSDPNDSEAKSLPILKPSEAQEPTAIFPIIENNPEIDAPASPMVPDLDLSSESESDESIDIILEQPINTESGDLVRLNVLEPRSKTDGAPTNGLNLGNGLDLDTPAFLDGVPLFDVVVEDLEEKPWRKPGADRTDYFNYGFDERSWLRYSQRQQMLRDSGGLMPQMGPIRGFPLPNHAHHGGMGPGSIPPGANRSGPVRFSLEAAFPRQTSINQSGATQATGSERDRDSLASGDPDSSLERNHHGRAPFHGFPGQPGMPNTLPPLSYSFNAPPAQNRGMHGFTPSFLPPPIANARPAKGWRPRSPSPHTENRDSRPRDAYSKRHSSRSPSRSHSPRTRHRARTDSSRDPITESQRDSGRRGAPASTSTKDSNRERRHRREGSRDSRSSKDAKESTRNQSRDSKERDRTNLLDSFRDKDSKGKDRERSERRRDKEREKDRSSRVTSHSAIGSNPELQYKVKSDKTESSRTSREKDKEREREREKDKDRRHSSDKQQEKLSDAQQRRSIKDRLGNKVAPDDSSSSSRKRVKTEKDESRKHRH